MAFVGTRSVGQQRALEPDSMPNMPIVLFLYAVSAMKLRANAIALFFFQFRNECERIGRDRPVAVVQGPKAKRWLGVSKCLVFWFTCTCIKIRDWLPALRFDFIFGRFK